MRSGAFVGNLILDLKMELSARVNTLVTIWSFSESLPALPEVQELWLRHETNSLGRGASRGQTASIFTRTEVLLLPKMPVCSHQGLVGTLNLISILTLQRFWGTDF